MWVLLMFLISSLKSFIASEIRASLRCQKMWTFTEESSLVPKCSWPGRIMKWPRWRTHRMAVRWIFSLRDFQQIWTPVLGLPANMTSVSRAFNGLLLYFGPATKAGSIRCFDSQIVLYSLEAYLLKAKTKTWRGVILRIPSLILFKGRTG